MQHYVIMRHGLYVVTNEPGDEDEVMWGPSDFEAATSAKMAFRRGETPPQSNNRGTKEAKKLYLE
jgi:hypothetical protein